MSHQAHDLATRFEQANRAVVAAVEGCVEARLHTLCPAEGCTVAALACHVADNHARGADWVRKVLDGEALPPITTDTVDRVNAQDFARNAYRTKREALERLRRNGAEAATLLRELDDADLDRTAPFTLFGGPTISVRELVELVLIGDPESHLRSIHSAIGAKTLA